MHCYGNYMYQNPVIVRNNNEQLAHINPMPKRTTA